MATSTRFQLASEAAERYQAVLVAHILGPFAEALVDRAAIVAGHAVVDIGTGTGEAARLAACRATASGRVIACDINESVLAVAEQIPGEGAPIRYAKIADAADLDLGDGEVDVALCAQAFQFFPRPDLAAAEMHRVLRSGGRAAISVWCGLADNPYFDALVASIDSHLGAEVAGGLRAAIAGNGEAIERALGDVGFRARSEVVERELELPPLAEFIPRHITATPMIAGYNAASHDTRAALVSDVIDRLGGGRRFIFRSHIAVGERC